MRVVMGSGLDQAQSFPRLLRIQCGFVSFRPFPAPSPRAASSRAHPIPSRFVPSYPPNPLDCFAPITLIAITPRLSCRRNGASFLNASNSMPLKSGLRSGFFLAACLPSYGFPAAPSAHLIISSRCASLLALLTASSHLITGLVCWSRYPITHRQSPRQSCRRTGRRMCLDAVRSIPWICDSRDSHGAFALSSLLANHPIISSHFFPRPAPSPRLSLVCLL